MLTQASFKMREVVVTGMGLISCIGNDLDTVSKNLKAGKSGIKLNQEYVDMGFRSHVCGSIDIDLKPLIDRKVLRFMGNASAYAYLAAKDALTDAGLNEDDISSPRIGLVAGSGGASSAIQIEAADITRSKGPKRVGPYAVPKAMGSTVSAVLSTALKIKGVNYSITSACSTSAHCIGHGANLIQNGLQDIVIAGGGEDEHWSSSSLFDAMGALSSQFNEQPTLASRPFDKNRDGFVIAGGSGMVILEEKENALKRGAKIYGTLKGFCANSDGYDMVAPSGEGAARCMSEALSQYGQQVDYINAHGTSTPVGDIAEINAIKEVFSTQNPYLSSTKSLTGHSLGATGAQEVIYSMIMMNGGFISPSINVEDAVEEIGDINLVTKENNENINSFMSNSFGFGGTNACLIFSKD